MQISSKPLARKPVIMNSRSCGGFTLKKNTLFKGGIFCECRLRCILHMFSTILLAECGTHSTFGGREILSPGVCNSLPNHRPIYLFPVTSLVSLIYCLIWGFCSCLIPIIMGHILSGILVYVPQPSINLAIINSQNYKVYFL